MQILKDSEDKIYTNFIYSFKTEVTRKNSISILKYYMNFLGITALRELVEKPQKIIESDIKAYLVFLRNKKKVSYNTTILYLSVIKKFYIVNTDYQIKWNLINMYLGNDDTDNNNDFQLHLYDGYNDIALVINMDIKDLANMFDTLGPYYRDHRQRYEFSKKVIVTLSCVIMLL